MNKPQLIAETPRAGKWNHRFIAAQDCSLSDSEIQKIVTAARRNPQGDDYLAVSVEMAQSVSGRTGKEILVLVGVNAKKLSETQRQPIVTQLKKQLKNLATLVTEIDWDRDGQAILVKRRELGEWEKGFSEFVPKQDKKAAVPKKHSSDRLKWVSGLVGILLALGVGFYLVFDSAHQSEENEKKPRQNSCTASKNEEKALKALFSDFDCETNLKEKQQIVVQVIERVKTEITNINGSCNSPYNNATLKPIADFICQIIGVAQGSNNKSKTSKAELLKRLLLFEKPEYHKYLLCGNYLKDFTTEDSQDKEFNVMTKKVKQFIILFQNFKEKEKICKSVQKS